MSSIAKDVDSAKKSKDSVLVHLAAGVGLIVIREECCMLLLAI